MDSHRLSGEGNILIFNNGDRSTRPWSSAIEILTPLRHDGLHESDSSGVRSWRIAVGYRRPPESLFGAYASGVQRLASGNTLIAVTEAGRFREVDPQGRLVVEYQLEATASRFARFAS